MARKRRRRNRQRSSGIQIPKKFLPLLIAGAGGVMVVIAGLLAFGGGGSGTPDLVIEQESYDYGEVAFNTPITTTFVLHNEGDGPLKIMGEPQVELKDGC